MTAPVFVAGTDLLAGVRPGDEVTLDGPEGRHAVSVRRLRAGEEVVLTDGAGTGVLGAVAAAAGKDRLTVTVSEVRRERAPAPRITVVQALPKGDRGELAVEMMTETGVDAIVPWAAARCVTRWRGERGHKALAKWRTVAREAGKQSRRLRFPEVTEPVTTTGELTGLLTGAGFAAVLHEEGGQPLATVPLPGAARTADGSAAADAADAERAADPADPADPVDRADPVDLVLVVGPEGGIAPEELAACTAAGARSCRLGPSVLRTSTAGTAAAALLLARTGRWV